MKNSPIKNDYDYRREIAPINHKVIRLIGQYMTIFAEDMTNVDRVCEYAYEDAKMFIQQLEGFKKQIDEIDERLLEGVAKI